MIVLNFVLFSKIENKNQTKGGFKINGNYFRLPNQIFGEGLTTSEFVVYSYLVKCSDKSQQCFPSRRNIARECNISVNTVDKALNGLIDKCLIEKTMQYDFSKEQ